MNLSPRTQWLCAAAIFLIGQGRRRDLEDSSTQWLAEPDSPDSLVRLADPTGSPTLAEVGESITELFDEVGGRPSQNDLPWIAGAASLLRLPEAGARTTVERLSFLAINFEWTADALVAAVILSDDLEDGVPVPPGGIEAAFAELRSKIVDQLSSMQISAWRASIDELSRSLKSNLLA